MNAATGPPFSANALACWAGLRCFAKLRVLVHKPQPCGVVTIGRGCNNWLTFLKPGQRGSIVENTGVVPPLHEFKGLRVHP